MDQNPWSQHAGLELQDGVATVSIRDAGKLNILGTPVIAALTAVLTYAGSLQDVRVVVLRGTGDKAFVAGADIKEMAALDRTSAEVFIDGLRRLCDTVQTLPMPVIARLPGWSLGGGLELALACDLRVAAEDAKFGMPEVKVGIPSIIHAALLPRLIGRARATWMLLTGEIMAADEALACGLVDRVVPLADLDAEVARVASLLAGCGPRVLAQQKRLLREWEDQPLDTAIRNGVPEFGAAFQTGEPQRFMGEFVEEQARRKRERAG
ncbi:enoyl-CoA hydratase/isomerase family protein [Achromobacter sp. GG226]|uniref:enoyl-CoA hydratase n=1 Tax=Verticiella alkaliphila TaxID=2779529 RepID=UPI001C0E5DB7|nr:enoyl-CoA hydratase [Verticiella sp. GG226]MBU4611493.1 enoyl-CoA hydratase/isomerase family protein [Verticiella sp. GG226]